MRRKTEGTLAEMTTSTIQIPCHLKITQLSNVHAFCILCLEGKVKINSIAYETCLRILPRNADDFHEYNIVGVLWSNS